MSQADPPERRPLIFLMRGIKTPPVSAEARRQIGFLLHRIQSGQTLSMPISRPMPTIGPGVHELRVSDERSEWRVVYQVRPDAILIGEIFSKKTRGTPKQVIEQCRRRFEQAE